MWAGTLPDVALIHGRMLVAAWESGKNFFGLFKIDNYEKTSLYYKWDLNSPI